MKKRESFSSRWGFVLACIGSAVGMGNIWMFPTRVSLYGGGSFIIPYILFVILISSTGMIGEMCFGRATRSGPVKAFGQACEMAATARTEKKKERNYKGTSKGKKRELALALNATDREKVAKRRKIGEALGMIPVLGSLAMAIGYTVVMGWILKYVIGTFTGATLAADSVDGYASAFGTTASAFGNNSWLLIALVIAIVILMFGVGRGIEKANKIMMPLFFLLFVFLGIYLLFQPGAMEGYRYIFRVDWEALKDSKTWVYALGQAFFSLSIAGNGTLIYGSYLSDEENIPASAARVAFFDTMAAILAAFVIIPAMATAGTQLNEGGPGLMFIYLPNLFHSMPGGSLFAIVFFVAVLFAGMTSLINLYETPVATVQEIFKLDRVKACAVVGGFSAVVALCIQGIVSGWMDVLSIFICPLGAGLAAIMFFWMCGKKFVMEQVNTGRERPLNPKFYTQSKIGFCFICILVLVVGSIMGGIG